MPGATSITRYPLTKTTLWKILVAARVHKYRSLIILILAYFYALKTKQHEILEGKKKRIPYSGLGT